VRGGPPKPSVAIIGAGVAGLACARALADRGCQPVVFDRGRRPGGRLTARSIAVDPGQITHADHGAPFFTCTEERFATHLQSWISAGVCAEWNVECAVWREGTLQRSRPAERLFVGTPEMQAIAEHLGRGLDIRSGFNITAIGRGPGGWVLHASAAKDRAHLTESFSSLVIATAPSQAAQLLEGRSEHIAQDLSQLKTAPCWAHTVILSDELAELPPFVRAPDSQVIELVIREDSKPNRTRLNRTTVLVVHATAGWSAARYEADPTSVGEEMTQSALTLVRAIVGRDVQPSAFTPAQAHRWGMARTLGCVPAGCSADDQCWLVVCGDGFGGSGVQHAFLSGLTGAERVLDAAHRP